MPAALLSAAKASYAFPLLPVLACRPNAIGSLGLPTPLDAYAYRADSALIRVSRPIEGLPLSTTGYLLFAFTWPDIASGFRRRFYRHTPVTRIYGALLICICVGSIWFPLPCFDRPNLTVVRSIVKDYYRTLQTFNLGGFEIHGIPSARSIRRYFRRSMSMSPACWKLARIPNTPRLR